MFIPGTFTDEPSSDAYGATERLEDLPMRVIRACFGKQRFDCRSDAQKALRHHLKRGRPTSLNVYRCQHCGGFHIGNKF